MDICGISLLGCLVRRLLIKEEIIKHARVVNIMIHPIRLLLVIPQNPEGVKELMGGLIEGL